MKKRMQDYQDPNIQEMERVLRQASEMLPKPQKEIPVSATRKTDNERYCFGRTFRRVAVVMLSVVLLGGSTVVAASPVLRQTVIQFFTQGAEEKVPYDMHSATKQMDDKDHHSDISKTAKTSEEAQTTVGAVTLLQNQVLDEHFTASYLFSSDYLNVFFTPSGKMLFYTQDETKGDRTYYQFADGTLQSATPKTHVREGRISLGNLPGIMGCADRSVSSVQPSEITFKVEWQQWEQEILALNVDDDMQDVSANVEKKAQSEEGMQDEYKGAFSAYGLAGDPEWVEIYFWFDTQVTHAQFPVLYQYPFLFNVHTGEVRDPLADVDLSAYVCMVELAILEDQKTATAMAGPSYNDLRPISIDLVTGDITEETVPSAPVADCYMSMATSSHTVFYTIGTEEHMDGYLYDQETDTATQLFQDAAWGYTWEEGLADTYVRMLRGNYAALYKEQEDKVYLLNLTDGSLQLLEDIPASHSTKFFWNSEYSVLSIMTYESGGTSRLAFFVPGTDQAWYFDRELSDNIQEELALWYGEYGYLIQSVSKNRDKYYLNLYEYTP